MREEMLMRAIAREIDGNTFLTRSVIEANMASGSKNAASLLYRNSVGLMLQGNALIRMHPMKDLKRTFLSKSDQQEIGQMSTCLKILKRTDFYERMARTLVADR